MVRNKVPGLHKLDIMDNTTAVCKTSEKELFFEVYNKHKTRQGPHWSRMLGEDNRIVTESWHQGQYDIKWKTVPLLKHLLGTVSVPTVLHDPIVVLLCYRISLMQQQLSCMAHLLQSCISNHMAQHLLTALRLWTSGV